MKRLFLQMQTGLWDFRLRASPIGQTALRRFRLLFPSAPSSLFIIGWVGLISKVGFDSGASCPIALSISLSCAVICISSNTTHAAESLRLPDTFHLFDLVAKRRSSISRLAALAPPSSLRLSRFLGFRHLESLIHFWISKSLYLLTDGITMLSISSSSTNTSIFGFEPLLVSVSFWLGFHRHLRCSRPLFDPQPF